MKVIDEIYQELVLKGKYDEEHANKAIEEDGYLLGVCIDFSKYLVDKMRLEGYEAHIISTKNDDNYKHAAVVYKDIESPKLYIADPVTDIRMFTENEFDILQREQFLKKSNNQKREVEGYIKEFGEISLYNENIVLAKDSIKSLEELEEAIDIGLNYWFDEFNEFSLNKNTGTIYDIEGYDREGYDREGYDREGYDKEGYDSFGYDKEDYDKEGYNSEGYDKESYDREGYDYFGYDKEGYDRNGFSIKGIHKNGTRYNKEGYDKDGYDEEGYDIEGYDRKGFSKEGIHKNGTRYNKEGYDKEGYNKEGYDVEGYNKEGYDKEGYDRKGFSKEGMHKNGTRYNKEGYDKDGYDKQGYDIEGYDKEGYNREGYNREGYDREGYNSKGYDKEGYDKNDFDIKGIHRNGTKYNQEGYDKYGYGEDGYNKNGFNVYMKHRNGTYFDENGLDKKGRNKQGFFNNGIHPKTNTKFDPDGFDMEGYDEEGFDKKGYNREGYNREGYDREGYDKQGYNIEGYNREGYNKDGFNKDGKTIEEMEEIDNEKMNQRRKNYLGLLSKAEKLGKGQLSIQDYISTSKTSIEELIMFAKKEKMSADIIRGLYKQIKPYKLYSAPFNKKQYLEQKTSIMLENNQLIQPTEQDVDRCIEYLRNNGIYICDKNVRDTIRMYIRGEIDISTKEEGSKTELEKINETESKLSDDYKEKVESARQHKELLDGYEQLLDEDKTKTDEEAPDFKDE